MDTASKPIACVRAGKEGRGRAPSVGSPTELKIKVSRGACAATIVNVLTSLVDSKRDLMLELFYADEVPKDPHCAPAADISGEDSDETCSVVGAAPAVKLHLDYYVQTLIRDSQASSAELVATVIYLLRFKRLYPDAAVSSPHRMFLTTLMLASKFVLDSTYKLSDWAVLGRFFSVTELRRCEAELIHYLDWKLFIRATEYATTAKAILDEAAVAAELAASKAPTSSGKRSGRAAKNRKPATAAADQGKRTRRSAALPARTASTAPPQRTGPGDCVAVSIPASAAAATDSAPVIATSA